MSQQLLTNSLFKSLQYDETLSRNAVPSEKRVKFIGVSSNISCMTMYELHICGDG